MGSIKKLRKKYQTPSHSWEKDRIVEEKEYSREYGLKNKKELWKMSSLLAKFKALAKDAITSQTAQSEKESAQLLSRLRLLGLLNETSMLADVLTLTDKDIFERRLQTVVFRTGLARSIKQSRQFIVHGHIKINNIAISSPSYLVKKSEEENITFDPVSALANAEHPERTIKPQAVKTESKSEDKKDAKEETKKEEPKKKAKTEKKEEKSDAKPKAEDKKEN